MSARVGSIFFLVSVPYLTIFLVLVCAKKEKHVSTSESSSEEHFPVEKYDPKTSLDMSGSLRKYFSLEAALLNANRNMICSPLSALMPLAKLALGARKKSESELLSAIGLKKSGQIANAFKKIIKDLEYLPGVTLDIASRLYVNKEVKIRSSYKSRASKIFKSTVENIRMSSPKHAADEINDWVSKQTRGMIQNIMKPDDLPPETKMVLINAIFFVGFWKHPFDTVTTDNFHTPNGVRRIPMMSQKESFNYRQDDVLNAQIVEIPYVGAHASFIILLPMKQGGLLMMLKQLKLAPNLLHKALDKMKQTKVNLTMPKFMIETHLDLKTLYRKIGVNNIFETKATLSRIFKDDEKIYVTNAFQKAVIEVNELGTKAAAASGMAIQKISTFMVQVLADRPFFFFVKTKYEQLFAGIYNGV